MDYNNISEYRSGPYLKLREQMGAILFFPLQERENIMGCSRNCQIFLPYKDIKEKHACIFFEMGKFYLSSLIIDQPLLVNDEPASNIALNNGDYIQIGSIKLEFFEKDAQTIHEHESLNNLPSLMNHLERDDILKFFSKIMESITQLLNQRDSKEAAIILVKIVAQLMQCDGVRLLSKDVNSDTYIPLAVFPEQASEERFSRTALSMAEQTGKTVLSSNNDQVQTNFEDSMFLKKINSVLCAPVGKVKGAVLGYLYLDRLHGHKPFNEKERELFEKLAVLFSDLLINAFQKDRQKAAIKNLQEKVINALEKPLIYRCAAMQNLLNQASDVACTDIPVLITGPTGAGKDKIAQFIHRASLRREKPFLAINCGAIPANLMESEFFGHEKGAFTGADTSKKGHLAAAHQGTIFLDEIAELPLNLQVKLLRVIQQKEIVPLGSSRPVMVDVRIISASNKNLSEQVKQGKFREDLFFRINVVDLNVPPLKERGEDILLLANHFLKLYALQYGYMQKTFTSRAEQALMTYSWPGNIRELENAVQRAIVLSRGDNIDIADLNFEGPEITKDSELSLDQIREQAERVTVKKILAKTRGNITMAGKMLKVERTVLSRLLQKLKIRSDDFKS
ncbi:MAG: sigma 54-interacting transcriptional regulator [bacterium]